MRIALFEFKLFGGCFREDLLNPSHKIYFNIFYHLAFRYTTIHTSKFLSSTYIMSTKNAFYEQKIKGHILCK